MSEISSRTNPRFKRWLSLTESKGVHKEGLCLVSGNKLVSEVIDIHPDKLVELLLPPKATAPKGYSCPTIQLSSALFKEIDVIGTRSPLAVVKTPPIAKWTPTAPQGLELVLALSDPGNLGSVLRSAYAFGVQRVILTEECASPFLPKSLRASAGASLRMNFSRAPKLASLEIAQGVGLDMKGEDIAKFEWPQSTYLVLGEEGLGLPKNLLSQKIKIPMTTTMESLNATVAASIALFSYQQQHSR